MQRLLELGVQTLGNCQRGVEADEIGEVQWAHWVVAAFDHPGIDVLGGGEARLHHPDRREQVGNEQRIHDESSPVLAVDDSLVERLFGEALGSVDRLRCRHQAGDEFDELQDGDRVEKVDANNLFGSLGGDTELHDGNRRGVAREDRVRVLDDPVERLEDLSLGLLVLDHCLDDELTVGEVAEIGGERKASNGAVAFGFGELA